MVWFKFATPTIYFVLMLAFIIRRLLWTLPVLFIVVTLVFGLIHMVPGDPVAQMLGEGAAVSQVQQLRHDLGLDRPILEQYRVYLSGVVRGDLGNSFRNQEPVARSIMARYPATVELAIAAAIFSLLIAIPCGVVAAIRRGRTADRLIGLGSLFWVSLPNFALGPLLILFGVDHVGTASGFRSRWLFASHSPCAHTGLGTRCHDDTNGAEFDA
jgi:peptide/nickel transport system permease protein